VIERPRKGKFYLLSITYPYNSLFLPISWGILYDNSSVVFPSTALHVNDAFKGSLSAASERALAHASCLCHVAENVQKRYPGSFGFALKPWVYMLAKAGTLREFEAVFDQILVMFDKERHLTDAVQYLRNPAPEFAAYLQLEDGIVNFAETLR
jgi:hypothetical protein